MTFTDVLESHWAKKDIEKVAAAGFMVGDPGGFFRPDAPITRAEVASLFARQMAWDGSFKDVLPGCMEAVFQLMFSPYAGSGFFVTNQGHIITNKHVVSASTSGVMTKIKEGKQNISVRILAVDIVHDLALLKLDGAATPFLKLAVFDVERGDHVGVIGSPKGYNDTFTQGVVSHPRRAGDPMTNVIDCFQLDAPISPGYSGGPVINELGECAGVECSKYTAIDTEGLAWAIHAKYVRQFCKANGVSV